MSASWPASSLFTDIAGGPARIPNQPNDPDGIPGEAMISRARFAIVNNEFRMVEQSFEVDDVAMGGKLSPTRELEPQTIGKCKSKADP